MSAWTEHRIDELKRLWRQGRGADAIARELGGGLTRNAVLGKIARLGLSHPRPGGRGRRTTPDRPSPEPPAQGVATVLSVGRLDCRWPYGDPRDPDFSLCGRPSERGAYCAAHAARAYQRVPLSIEALLRLIARVS